MTIPPGRMRDVWEYLRKRGPSTSTDVAERFYPRLSAIGQMGGGPTRGETVALWLLGRMRARGIVAALRLPDGGKTIWSAREDPGQSALFAGKEPA